MKNEAIAIASHHIELSERELLECSQRLYQLLETMESKGQEDLERSIHEALATLQMQDIISQRLRKIKEFLTLLDTQVELELPPQYLEEFAWENEVDQEDVDSMFNKVKG